MGTRASLVMLTLALFGGPQARAHHSFAAEFSYEESGTIEGEVVEVLYVNPHARYFIAVKDEAGKQILWDAQTRSPNALLDAGWTKDTLKVGERVSIEGNLGREGARKIWIREVRKASGELVYPSNERPVQ
jgi:hypothetical protein